MHLGQGGPDHPSGERGGQEEAGCDEDGGADEGGEEGPVDGLSSWPWLGEKRQMSWNVKKKSKEYIPKKNNFHVCNQKSTNQFIEYHFLINVGRRILGHYIVIYKCWH